jgi:hypothetical protein
MTTAHDLIGDFFSRPQANIESNKRYITPAQWKFLVDLIGQDPEGSAIENGANGGLVWMPSGRWKYVLSQNPDGTRKTLTRLNAGRPVDAGRLFG